MNSALVSGRSIVTVDGLKKGWRINIFTDLCRLMLCDRSRVRRRSQYAGEEQPG